VTLADTALLRALAADSLDRHHDLVAGLYETVRTKGATTREFLSVLDQIAFLEKMGDRLPASGIRKDSKSYVALRGIRRKLTGIDPGESGE
jgi:hypothetical protein